MVARTFVVLILLLGCPAAIAASPAGTADLATFLAAPTLLAPNTHSIHAVIPERVPALELRLRDTATRGTTLVLDPLFPALWTPRDTASIRVGDGKVRAGLSATRLRTNLEQLLYGATAPSMAGDAYLFPLLGRDRAPSRIAVRLFFEIRF